jgi:hypothetical protein
MKNTFTLRFIYVAVLALFAINSQAQWAATGSLNTGRGTHCSIKNSNGDVMVIGGGNSNSLSSCELYSVANGTWSTLASMATPRSEHAVALEPKFGSIFVCGGYNGSSVVNSGEIYDAKNNSWKSMGNMSTARRNHTFTQLANGKFLVVGGRGTTSNALTSCEIYDPNTNTWSAAASLNTARYGHVTIKLSKGKILVIGGFGISKLITTCELYDEKTNTWSNTGALANGRINFCAIEHTAGSVLVAGGDNNAGTSLSSCEIYDVSTGTFSNTGSLSTARTRFSMVVINNGIVMAIGGLTGSTILTSCEIFNTNSWSAGQSLNTARAAFGDAITLSNKKILVSGGFAVGQMGLTQIASAELFTPCIDPTIPTPTISSTTICKGDSVTASILSGALNSAANWYWYSGSCGGTLLGTGTTIKLSPSTTTNYFVRGEGNCVTPSSCKSFSITVLTPDTIAAPTISASSSTFCGSQSITLSISSGQLGTAKNWEWYQGSCGSTVLGTDSTLIVTPTASTTYYAKAIGRCIYSSCGNISIIMGGAGAPTGANVYTGNITISTQAQMDAFYSTTAGTNYGKQYTKVEGILTIDGSSATDPITNFCNLSTLTEVTKNFELLNFNKTGNPKSLQALNALTTVGCRLNINGSTSFNDITLSNLAYVGCAININNNSTATTINLPLLAACKGDQMNIKNNPKLTTLSFSSSASSFSFTGKGSSIDVSNNGNTASSNLTMNFQKVVTVSGALVFNNNDNPGVTNFDNIFTGLTNLTTNWGKLTITNNDYLGTCCIAASAIVSGVGKRHIISGNTGNCADSMAVLNNCGSFHKRSVRKPAAMVQALQFNVYPNPNQGNFELNITTPEAGNLNITVTDLMGRTVYTNAHSIVTNTNLPIHLDGAANGTYILKAEFNGQIFVNRLVINH